MNLKLPKLFTKFYPTILAQILLTSALAQAQIPAEDAKFEFNRRHVGLAFSPYVKSWVNGTLPPYNSYSLAEIKYMLKIISTRFTNISTYGMGVDHYNVDTAWNMTDSNCFIATAAAELNREAKRLVITMSQGIHQNSNPAALKREIANAFTSTAYANTIFPGTVWGITYANQFINAEKGEALLEQIREGHRLVSELGLDVQLGSRIHNCGDVLELQGPNRRILEDFAQQLDYIMCNVHPNAEDVLTGPKMAALRVGERFLEFKSGFEKANPNVSVLLGETGWPSKGKSWSGPAEGNTIQNLFTYWTEMGKWASRTKIQVQMFEAFDEPWKSNFKITDPNQPDGRFGAEGHFGWWRRTDNNNTEAYVEKILAPPETFDDPDKPLQTGVSTIVIVSILIPLLIFVGLVISCLLYRLKQAKVKLAIIYKYVGQVHCSLDPLTHGFYTLPKFLMISTNNSQQKTIARLSESEIKEFLEGNPAAVKTGDPEDKEIEANALPYNREYELPKNKIHIEKERILGQGQFGVVFKGRFQMDETFEEIALKTTKTSTSVEHLKSLLSELKLMIYIGKHPNVIRLIGAYTEEIRDGVVYIGTEFCGRGSLEKLLRSSTFAEDGQPEVPPGFYVNFSAENTVELSSDRQKLSLKDFRTWSAQIAHGMKYLESKNVIHSDLAARNILVASDLSLRITDFGLSRRLYEYTSYVKTRQEPLPWRWMAYESLRSLQFSPQSDVWSYGVTLWEIYSLGDIPYPGLNWDINFVNELEKGLRMPTPKYAPIEIYTKMLECWNLDPLHRPTFSELYEFFKSALEQ